MAKITVNLCDVKPCTSLAEREYVVNNQTLFVCGEQCYSKFWSREYGNWKESRHIMQVSFHPLALLEKYDSKEANEVRDSLSTAGLHIAKRKQG